MVLDVDALEAGAQQDVLWILEQLPGYVQQVRAWACASLLLAVCFLLHMWTLDNLSLRQNGAVDLTCTTARMI
jgi:hypothetical protein